MYAELQCHIESVLVEIGKQLSLVLATAEAFA